MKGNWEGNGTIPVQCPTWAILLWITREELNNLVALEVLIPNRSNPSAKIVLLAAIHCWLQMALKAHDNSLLTVNLVAMI